MIRSFQNIGLKTFNTMGLDSLCANLIEFDSPEDAPGAVALARSTAGELPVAVIGGGSNLVFGKEFRGCLIHPAIMGWEATPLGDGIMEITVGAGVVLDSLIEQVCNAGFWGMENLSGIPGSVGGASVQNAGAYGVEIGDLIKTVHVWDCAECSFKTFTRGDLEYGYRFSIFKRPENNGRFIVLQVCLEVSKVYNPKLSYGPLKELADHSSLTPADVRESVLKIRDSKLPRVEETGSAGSYFKNPVLDADEWMNFQDILISSGYAIDSVPHFNLDGGAVKVPAAWLIEQCGWKGKTLGNAGVWHKQPLILVNATGKATSEEISELEKAIVADVKDRFGIELYTEVVHL